jgi:DNA-binding response OmpR family regulator
LVDDERDILTTLKTGLERANYSVDAFEDPRLALTNYQSGSYDAIVLDIRMWVMNGFELAKQIWAIDEKARICFLSAFEIYESEAKMVFKDFKTHCFIKKPITSADLVRHIESHVLSVPKV